MCAILLVLPFLIAGAILLIKVLLPVFIILAAGAVLAAFLEALTGGGDSDE
jgi:hypothetical protein